MNTTTLGIDLAKNIFQLHGVDKNGCVTFRKALSRSKFPVFTAQLPPCLIGIEACGSSHYWARKLKKQGHEVKIMAANFEYRKNKGPFFENDKVFNGCLQSKMN